MCVALRCSLLLVFCLIRGSTRPTRRSRSILCGDASVARSPSPSTNSVLSCDLHVVAYVLVRPADLRVQIGGTPMVRLDRLLKNEGLEGKVELRTSLMTSFTVSLSHSCAAQSPSASSSTPAAPSRTASAGAWWRTPRSRGTSAASRVMSCAP